MFHLCVINSDDRKKFSSIPGNMIVVVASVLEQFACDIVFKHCFYHAELTCWRAFPHKNLVLKLVHITFSVLCCEHRKSIDLGIVDISCPSQIFCGILRTHVLTLWCANLTGFRVQFKPILPLLAYWTSLLREYLVWNTFIFNWENNRC